MKLLFVAILSSFSLLSFAQDDDDNKILIQVQIVDGKGNPVPDVYVINMNTHEKDVSRYNGVVTLSVSPDDSLGISHISYERKMVPANDVLINPKIVLEAESVNLKPVNVSAKTDMDRAMENLEQIKFDMRTRPDDISTEADRVNQTFVANNRVERASAGMLSLGSFSPSEKIKKVSKKLKKDDRSDFYSTKKTKEEIEKREARKEAWKNFYRKKMETDTIIDSLNINFQSEKDLLPANTEKEN